MNSFTTTLITFLLNWLRSFISEFWLLLSGGHPGSVFSFVQQYWLAIFLCLCLGGFFLDCVVYLFRWRPHYVWASRLDRLKGRFGKEKPAKAHSHSYAPPPPAFQNEPFYPQNSQSPASPFQDQSYEGYTQTIQPLDYSYTAQDTAPIEPVFDEISEPWSTDFHLQETKVSSIPYGGGTSILSTNPFSEPMENPGEGLSATFGTAKTEPEQHFYDSLAGFAPPMTPKELYPATPADSPIDAVHPGLDAESFQQSFGLSSAETENISKEPLLRPTKDFSNNPFVPFSQSAKLSEPPLSPRPLSNLAKKARNLIADSEENPPSIRDLQSPVDFREAFHAPVFPQNPAESGDEE